jgi:hypothetical protein
LEAALEGAGKAASGSLEEKGAGRMIKTAENGTGID